MRKETQIWAKGFAGVRVYWVAVKELIVSDHNMGI